MGHSFSPRKYIITSICLLALIATVNATKTFLAASQQSGHESIWNDDKIVRYRLQDDNSGSDLEVGNKKSHLNTVITICIAILLACASAIFSGLTLGMMMLDVIQLRIMMDASEKDADPAVQRDAKRAKRIYFVRKNGNLLLVTLLIGNVSVNSAFSIITSDLTSGIVGFVLSTSIITLFGEIFPQAFCSRYGLATGYYLCPIVVLIEVLFYPIVKPISMVLDFCLGQDLGTIYSREQLKALLQHHEKEVKMFNRDEARILFGGFDMASKTVASVMTPLEHVFGLRIDEKLTFETAGAMITSGFSRIPVFDNSTSQSIVGVLHAKDIALIDPVLELPVRSILSMFGRSVYAVDTETYLLELLTEFKKGRTHLAVARTVVEDPKGGDPYYKHVGIITLEDIIEEILQDEIRDEYEAQDNQASLDRKSPISDRADSVPRIKLKKSASRKMELINPSCSRSQMDETSGRSRRKFGIAIKNLFSRSDSKSKTGTPVALSGDISLDVADGSVVLPKVSYDPNLNPNAPLSPTAGRDVSFQDSVLSSASFLVKNRSNETPSVVGIPISGSPVLHRHDPAGLFAPQDISEPGHSHAADAASMAVLGRLRLFDRRRKLEPLSSNEAAAVSLFLAATQPPFRSPYVSQNVLHQLLCSVPVYQPDGSKSLYVRGEATDYMLLILQGNLNVISGSEEFECCMGPWSVLGIKALGPPPLSIIELPETHKPLPLLAKYDSLQDKTASGITKGSLTEGCPSESSEGVNVLNSKLHQWAATYRYIPDFTTRPSQLPGSREPTDSPLNRHGMMRGAGSGGDVTSLRCVKITRAFYLHAICGTAINKLKH